MRKVFILVLACSIIATSATATSQTRRRSAPRRKANLGQAATDKSSVDIKAARERVASQAKVLTHFLYLYGGVVKSIETADLATSDRDASAAAIEQNQRNKAKVKESIRNLREGLDRLANDFLANPTLKNYYSYIAGVARTVEAAENQAAANRFDEAGKSLLKAADQLADALAAMR